MNLKRAARDVASECNATVQRPDGRLRRALLRQPKTGRARHVKYPERHNALRVGHTHRQARAVRQETRISHTAEEGAARALLCRRGVHPHGRAWAAGTGRGATDVDQ